MKEKKKYQCPCGNVFYSDNITPDGYERFCEECWDKGVRKISFKMDHQRRK